MNEKSLYYANFNITFGLDYEPMLTNFSEAILPAFTNGYTKKGASDFPIYSFNDIDYIEQDNTVYLTGNFVKNTELVRETLQDDHGKINDAQTKIPTSPFSRFIINLENHRMLLIKNENASPNILSFQATFRSFLRNAIRDYNDRLTENEKPIQFGEVNIVDIPLKGTVDTLVRGLAKVKFINLRFFPLNNDFEFSPMLNETRGVIESLGSKSANTKINSPKNISRTVELVHEAADNGTAIATLSGEDDDGATVKISQESFTTQKKFPTKSTVSSEMDKYLIKEANEDEIFTKTSSSNRALFSGVKDKIISALKRI